MQASRGRQRRICFFGEVSGAWYQPPPLTVTPAGPVDVDLVLASVGWLPLRRDEPVLCWCDPLARVGPLPAVYGIPAAGCKLPLLPEGLPAWLLVEGWLPPSPDDPLVRPLAPPVPGVLPPAVALTAPADEVAVVVRVGMARDGAVTAVLLTCVLCAAAGFGFGCRVAGRRCAVAPAATPVALLTLGVVVR